MGISPHGGSVGQPGEGASTGDFGIWLKGALRVEWLSLWELVKGTWREGSLAGDPEGHVEKAPFWGTWGRAHLLGTLRDV
jgi:hypothetical protein